MKNILITSAILVALASCGGGSGGGGGGKSPGKGSGSSVGTATVDGDQVKISDGSSVSVDIGSLNYESTNGFTEVSTSASTKNFLNGTSEGYVAAYVNSKGSVLTGIPEDQVKPSSSATYSGSYKLIAPESPFDSSETGMLDLVADLDAGTVKSSGGDLDIDAKINGTSFEGTAEYTGSSFSPAVGESGIVGGGFYDTDGTVAAGALEGEDAGWAGVFTTYSF